MKKETTQPLARAAYTELAEAYAAKIETKPHNAYYERPAMFSLLPDLKGKRVLDAGCGPGVYAEELIKLGAKVIGLDVTEKMLELAHKRLGTKVVLHLADLSQPLPFVATAQMDIVIAPLVLDYIKDWRVPFGEFFRVLKPGGLLIFSMEHPASAFRRKFRESYFTVEIQELEWRGFGPHVKMPSYRRSLQEALNPLIEVGFILDKVLEPQPTEEFLKVNPDDHADLSKNPGFLCLRARKPA